METKTGLIICDHCQEQLVISGEVMSEINEVLNGEEHKHLCSFCMADDFNEIEKDGYKLERHFEPGEEFE